MFTPDDQRGGGEGGGRKGILVIELIPVSTTENSNETWVLLLGVRSGVVGEQRKFGCMDEVQKFEQIATILQESVSVINAKFEKVLSSPGRQALKVGCEVDMKRLARLLDTIVCSCRFTLETVKSK